VLVANRSSDRMLVPYLVVVSGLLPQDHLRPRTFPGTLHVQYEPRIFADDHEILAFDPHYDRSLYKLQRTSDKRPIETTPSI